MSKFQLACSNFRVIHVLEKAYQKVENVKALDLKKKNHSVYKVCFQTYNTVGPLMEDCHKDRTTPFLRPCG